MSFKDWEKTSWFKHDCASWEVEPVNKAREGGGFQFLMASIPISGKFRDNTEKGQRDI